MNYTNPRMSATIENWPSGSKRVTAVFAIEADPKRGERAVRTTTGAPKKLTFARKMRIVDGDDGFGDNGRTYIAALTDFGHITIHRGDMKFHEETVHKGDPRYPQLLALFADGNQQKPIQYMKATEALDAIEAREQGQWDHPALQALGPLGELPDDLLAIKTKCLKDYGFTIGVRDPRIHTDYPGKWMVVECFEEAKLPSRDGSNGPWCVVGDKLSDLVDLAFNYVVGCDL